MNADITSILRLTSSPGRIVLVFYGIGTTVIAIMNLGGLVSPVYGVITLALLWTGLLLLGLPHGEPLGMRYTAAIIVIVAVATAISGGNVADPANPGFATWPLGAMTFLLFVLALRGRRWFAWVGFAALSTVAIAIALITAQAVFTVANDLLRQAATLVIGTLFAIVLRRATKTIASIQRGRLRLATLAAATASATGEGAAETIQLEREVRPALERVIDPTPFSERELRAFVAIESSVRFGTRPTQLSGDRLVDAAREATARGVVIKLFDDRGVPVTGAERASLEETMLPLFGDRSITSVIVRMSPVGSGELATIVVEAGGAYRRVVVSERVVQPV